VLSPETIARCIGIIKRRNDIDDTDPFARTSVATLANLFWVSDRLPNPSEGSVFNEQTVKKILEGQRVDEFSMREFLFLLGIVNADDEPIEDFLRRSAKTLTSKRDLPINSQDPCRLSKDSFVVGEKTASLSQDALDAINQIFNTEAFRRKKELIIKAHKPHIQDYSIRSFFTKRPKDKYIFRDILEALMAAGVVSLEQGTLEDMLDIPATSNGPHVLREGSFVMGTRGVSLSGDAARDIRDTLTRQRLTQAGIARDCGVGEHIIQRILEPQSKYRNTLEPILQYLINIGVVCLEKGQTLESLLAKKPEPLYEVPDAAQDITDGCMGSSGQSLPAAQALTAAVQAQELVRS
jgi:hypothetical protein